MKINHSGIGKEKKTMVDFDRGMQIPARVSRPDLSPEKMEVSDYSGERNAKIAQLEQQIAMVKERIARNERALTGKSYDDANNQIAALEMRKINSSDPTTLWRWQQQRQDTNAANAAQAAQQMATWQKDANYIVGAEYDKSNDASMVQAQNNIRKIIEDGKSIGKTIEDMAPLYAKLQRIQDDRDSLGVTVAKTNLIDDIRKTIAEGALEAANTDIADALESGKITERDAEMLRIRAKEKANQIYDTNMQRNQAIHSANRNRKKEAEEDAKQSDSDYINGLLGKKNNGR